MNPKSRASSARSGTKISYENNNQSDSFSQNIILGGGLLLTFILSCQKATIQQADEKLPSTNVLDRTTFSPTIPISKWNDMLVFNSWADFDKTLAEVTSAPPSQVDSWETSLNFLSQRQIFEQVSRAEDSINNYYESLPANQQAYFAAQPEPFSSQLTYWLQKGVIKNVTDPSDNSTYWNYSLVNIGVAPLVNEKGLVKVEGKIVQFTQNNLVKVILDGDFAKVANLPNLTTPSQSSTYWVFNGKSNGSPEVECYNNKWSKTNSWVTTATNIWGNPKKRAKVELVGFADANLFAFSGCEGIPLGTTCTNMIITKAMKKNIWGNWVFSLDYQPSLTIKDGNWVYNFGLYKKNCSGDLLNVGQIIDSPWAKPLWNKSVSATNNGQFFMNPHTSGWWTFYHEPAHETAFIYCTINVASYNIPVTYDGLGATVWNIVK